MGEGSPAPRDVPGREPAVLAIHGFGGTPLEVDLVVDVARELGLRAHAPLLPGHGTHAEDLAKTGFSDWYRGTEDALRHVASDGAPVIAVGLSLGSLLAAHLAITHPDRVLGLGMLANATRLAPLSTALPLRIIDRLRIPDFALPKVAADISDPETRKSHLTYGLQPVHAAVEVMRTGQRVEALLPVVTCPVFIAHGAKDHVCPVGNARRVASRIGSTDTTVLILPRSFHIVTRDRDRDTLRRELARFIRRVAGAAPRAPSASAAR